MASILPSQRRAYRPPASSPRQTGGFPPGTTSCPPVRQPTTRTYGRLRELCSQTRERGAYSIRPTMRPDAMPSRLEDPRGVRTVDMIEFSSGRIAGGCWSTARVVGRARLAGGLTRVHRPPRVPRALRGSRGPGDRRRRGRSQGCVCRPASHSPRLHRGVPRPPSGFSGFSQVLRVRHLQPSRRPAGLAGAGGCCRQRLRFAPPNAGPHRQHRNARVSPRTRRAIRGRNGAPERQSQDASLVGALRSRGCCCSADRDTRAPWCCFWGTKACDAVQSAGRCDIIRPLMHGCAMQAE